MQEPLTPIEVTRFARACGLRREDLQHVRRSHIVQDHFSQKIFIVFVREGQQENHAVPVLDGHEYIVLYLLEYHKDDDEDDLWVPMVPPVVDCNATRRYYAQHLYQQLQPSLGHFHCKRTLAAILEEPASSIVTRYGLTHLPTVSGSIPDEGDDDWYRWYKRPVIWPFPSGPQSRSCWTAEVWNVWKSVWNV